MSAIGIDDSSLLLPAPTETSSVIAPTELGTEVSRNDDIYSLPSDGTPVTITTRRSRAKDSQSQASVLIEYFETGKRTSNGPERKPSVRVRLTPGKSGHTDHIKFTENRSRTSRRTSELEDIEDALMSPYASATEESAVSRNPIDVEIDRTVTGKGRSGKRPVSPLIPETRTSHAGAPPPNTATGSDLSVIPTNSFLDDSGNSAFGEQKRNLSPPPKNRSQKPRQGERERIRLMDKPIEKEQREKRSKSKSGRSRASSLSTVQREREKERERIKENDKDAESYSYISHRDSINHGHKASRTRRSSRGAGYESVLSGAESTVSSTVSRAHEGQSVRSSEVNSKLLAAVEVALRKVVIPELEAIKRENSKRDTHRNSGGSSATSSLSRDDVSEAPTSRHRSSRSRSRHGREREKEREKERDKERNRDRDRERERERERERNLDHGRDKDQESSVLPPESVDDYYAETPKRSPDPARQHLGAPSISVVSSQAHSPTPEGKEKEKKPKRRRREGHRKRASDRYDEDFDDESVAPQPPMPLMSEVNPSEITRESLQSDRPASAMEEVAKSEISDGGALLKPDLKALQLGMQYANVSHGDLRALPRGNKGADKENQEPPPFPEEYEPDEYGQKVPAQSRQPEETEIYEDQEQPVGSEVDYEEDAYDNFYCQQDVPAHLKYVPYQPERRGLSPIYSVSGYTENSELAPRDSHVTASSEDPQSPQISPRHNRRSSVLSNSMLNSEIMENAPQSELGSTAGYPRNTAAYTELSELEPEPQQPVRGIALNPRFNPGAPVESIVASLIDGSLVEQSVMTSVTNAHGHYGSESVMSPGAPTSAISHGTDSNLSYEDPKHMVRELNINKRASEIMDESELGYDQDYDHEEEYDEEYEDGTATPKAENDAALVAITNAALAKAMQANQITIYGDHKNDVIPGGGAGVARNKSFKQRTMEGHELSTTPTHSVDRFHDDESQHEEHFEHKLGAHDLSEFDHEMPEYGMHGGLASDMTGSLLDDDGGHEYHHDEMSFVAGADDNISITPARDITVEYDEGHMTPRALSPKKSMPSASAEATGIPEGSRYHDDDMDRTSAERKRETIVTNPYENMSPIASQRETFGYGADAPVPKDEGYVSNGPIRTPEDFMDHSKGLSMPSATAFGGVGMDDSLFDRHANTLSPTGASPLYDSAALASGNISSKDIMALMQDLVARDAQRNARDTEIAAMVMFLANEMRTHFRTVEDRIKQAEDVIIDEVQDSEKMVIKAINGPRQYPGNPTVSRSLGTMPAGSRSNTNPEIGMAAKKGNILRRALNGLNVTGAKDLSRIEVMLHQLLEEVMELKGQQGQNIVHGGSTFENLGDDSGENDTADAGYDPEGHAGTSVASGSQSQSQSQSATRLARPAQHERKYSDHRVSTVPEGDEEPGSPIYDDEVEDEGQQLGTPRRIASPQRMSTPRQTHTGPRGEPIAMPSPCREPIIPPPVSARHSGGLASPTEAGPEASIRSMGKSEKSRKHKSSGSGGFQARISRWSETTASTFSKAFRSSGGSSKKNDPYMNPAAGHSRSGSDFGYDSSHRPNTAPYASDKLHTGFSETDIGRTPSPVIPGTPPPMPSYMSPDHPKYQVHRNSLNLQHPQPRQGNSERFKNNLESQAHIYDTVNTPRSTDWGNSVNSLNRYQGQHASEAPEDPATSAPPRPPKEPVDGSRYDGPSYSNAGTSQYGAGSPRSRDVERLVNMPKRRPSGPRAMTPKSTSTTDEGRDHEQRRTRNTFGSVASRMTADTDTF